MPDEPHTPTPITGTALPMVSDARGASSSSASSAENGESDAPKKWPAPGRVLWWIGLIVAGGAAVSVVLGAFYVRATVYDVDQKAQAAVNSQVQVESTAVRVHLDALQRQVEAQSAVTEKRFDSVDHKLDVLLERKGR